MTQNEKTIYKGRLKRLDPSYYQGKCYVHWTMSIQDRRAEWLNPTHYAKLSCLLIHCLARFHLSCPVYCIMPDHAHFIFIGLNDKTDQLKSIAWLRKEWNQLLSPNKLQLQAYDSVLKESDRQNDAFSELVEYVLKNPERAGLVEKWQEWDYSGCCFPGYPSLDPRKHYFWNNFWKAYQEQSDFQIS